LFYRSQENVLGIRDEKGSEMSIHSG